MHQGPPLVSVVVTTYNRPEMVKRALHSVFEQTYAPVEIIVVEDGSDSGIGQWLAEAGYDQVRYVRHKENCGLAVARNTGLRLAQGKYSAFLDDDDEWLPDKIRRQVEHAEKTSGDKHVVYCGLFSADIHGQLTFRPLLLKGDIRTEIGLKGLGAIPDNSGLYQTQALKHIGGFDEGVGSHTEYGIWMKMARAGCRADCVDEYLVKTYTHTDYKITHDIERRTRATEDFVNKWFPEWVQWFGPMRARSLRAELTKKVFLKLGEICVSKGRLGDSLRCYSRVVRQDPWRAGTYADLLVSCCGALLSATPLYSPVRTIWLKTNKIHRG